MKFKKIFRSRRESIIDNNEEVKTERKILRLDLFFRYGLNCESSKRNSQVKSRIVASPPSI